MSETIKSPEIKESPAAVSAEAHGTAFDRLKKANFTGLSETTAMRLAGILTATLAASFGVAAGFTEEDAKMAIEMGVISVAFGAVSTFAFIGANIIEAEKARNRRDKNK